MTVEPPTPPPQDSPIGEAPAPDGLFTSAPLLLAAALLVSLLVDWAKLLE